MMQFFPVNHLIRHHSNPRFPKFQNKARIELRLESANPLSDRKLLEELHEEGVRKYLRRWFTEMHTISYVKAIPKQAFLSL